MKCISCDNELHPFTTSSYLNLPTFACSRCGLCVTGSSDVERQEKAGYATLECDYLRPATKKEGVVHKIFKNKFLFYPRIVCNKEVGKYLRIILKDNLGTFA